MKDIVVKNYGSSRTIWLSEEMICSTCGVSDSYLRQAARHRFLQSVPESQRRLSLLPKTGESWRFTTIDGIRYYDLDAIPDRSPQNFKSKLPTERELLDMRMRPRTDAENMAIFRDNLMNEAMRYYDLKHVHYYMFEREKRRFNKDDAEQMAQAYSVCKYIAYAIEDKGHIQWGFERSVDFQESVCKYLEEAKLPNMTIGHPAALRKKVVEFRKFEKEGRGLECFVSSRYDNDNSGVVKTLPVYDQDSGELYTMSLHELVMYGLWNGGGAARGELSKQKKIMLHRRYVGEMERYGYKGDSMSYRTFCFHTNKWESKLFSSAGRDGLTLHNNRHRPYILTEGVQLPMSLWVGDGSGTKMVFQYRGEKRTLYRVNIFDVASQKIVGYSIQTDLRKTTEKESEEMVLEALNMAIKTSGGRVAHEFLTDNGGGFAKPFVKEVCEMLFPKYRTIKPGNSQENQAETLQRLVLNFCRRFDNFVGSQLGVKPENKTTNFEGFDINKLPTFEEAIQQQHNAISMWNNEVGGDGLSPNQRFDECKMNNGECKMTDGEFGVEVEERVMRYCFGMRSKVNLGWMRGKMTIVKNGIEYAYEIDLSANAGEINKRTGYSGDAEVTVCHDGVTADVYTHDGALICSCVGVVKSFKAEVEATEESKRGLGIQRNLREEFDRKVERTVQELEDSRFRLPLTGEVTEYGFAVAGKTKIKEELQDVEDYLLNESVEVGISNSNQRKAKVKEEKSVEEMAFEQL